MLWKAARRKKDRIRRTPKTIVLFSPIGQSPPPPPTASDDGYDTHTSSSDMELVRTAVQDRSPKSPTMVADQEPIGFSFGIRKPINRLPISIRKRSIGVTVDVLLPRISRNGIWVWGHFRNWYADEIVMDPWSIESIELADERELSNDAKEWLETFVRVNPQNTYRGINGKALDFPSKQRRVSFFGNRIRQLCSLSTGEIYPPDAAEFTYQLARELDAIDVPQTCWGLASVEGNAFSPDGSRLLVYCQRRKTKSKGLLALFEMPSGLPGPKCSIGLDCADDEDVAECAILKKIAAK